MRLKPMTAGYWLQSANRELQAAGIVSARLDSLILLEDSTNLRRANLLAHPDTPLDKRQLELLAAGLAKRRQRQPMAYIRGFKEFYGHRFQVTSGVLIPRPESEAFLELLAGCHPTGSQSLIDVGTGCGALAISAKLLFPELIVEACDISASALKTARLNAKQLKAKIDFIRSDLLPSGIKNYDYIFANLPYVPSDYPVAPEVMAEPRRAVFAGYHGLALIKKLAPVAGQRLKPGGLIFIESLPEQQAAILDYYQNSGFKYLKKYDLVQLLIRN